MDENQVQPETTVEETSAVDTKGTDTAGQGQEHKPEPAWKAARRREQEAKGEDAKPENQIPHWRFKEINDRRKEAEAKAAEYERKIAEYEAKLKPAEPEKPARPDFNDPKYGGDADKWFADVLEMERKEATEAAIKEMETRYQTQARQQQEREFERKLASDFEAKLVESEKADPEIREAIEWFGNTLAPHLSPVFRHAMVTDDNAPELIRHMAEDPTILRMVADGNEIGAIKAMAKWSALYDREHDTASRAASRDESGRFTSQTPSKPTGTIPKTVRGTVAGGKDPMKMNKQEYAAWRLANRR